MFSFLSAVVELVDLKERQIVFRSNRKYAVDKDCDIRMALPPGSGQVTDLQVRIRSARPLEKGGFVYVAEIRGDHPGLNLSGAATKKDAAMRRAARHDVSFRARSRQLPGFHALTVDLSESGMQIELDGEARKGIEVDLTLDVGRRDLGEVTVKAEVVWCRPYTRNRYRAGLRFVGMSPEAADKIRKMAAFLTEREGTDLQELLEEAKLLDPDMALGQQRVQPPAKDITVPSRDETVAHAPAPAPVPVKAVKPPAAAAPAALPAPPAGAISIPLRATIQGYRWHRGTRQLLLILQSSDGQDHVLSFENCQTLRDYSSAAGVPAAALRASVASPLLDEVVARVGPGAWKHYQILDAKKNLILEVVSEPCRAPD